MFYVTEIGILNAFMRSFKQVNRLILEVDSSRKHLKYQVPPYEMLNWLNSFNSEEIFFVIRAHLGNKSTPVLWDAMGSY